MQLGGAPTGGAFLIVADAGGPPIPGRLQLRTTDGSQGTVTISSPSASLQFSPDTVQAGAVLTAFELTAIARPAVRFRGTFQCRLSTDPDAFDDPWGRTPASGCMRCRARPECVFDGRNRQFAPDGFEQIANFRLNVEDVFAGASAPAPGPSPRPTRSRRPPPAPRGEVDIDLLPDRPSALPAGR